jgi:hypothetical protein
VADLINPNGIPLVNSTTNMQETVPWDQAHAALVSGTHNLQAGQLVNVVNPDGHLVSLPAEQIPEAIQSGGYTISGQAPITEYNNQQKYGEGLGPEAAAGAAAAARMASFGISDQLMTRTGAVEPNTLKQLSQRNPLSDFVGSVGGVFTPGSLVGVAGKVGTAITKAALPTTTNIASHIVASLGMPETSSIVAKIIKGAGEVGAKTLGSSVEATAYGLGNLVSENALGNADINAENILHNVGYSALFGGALGATLGTVGAIKGAFGKGAAEAATKDALIENAALAPTSPLIKAPQSMEEIKALIQNAAKEGLTTELTPQSRILEINDILAGESKYPAHQLQIQSLSSPAARDIYKTLLENASSEDGKLLNELESVQKVEGTKNLLPRFIQKIAPDSTLTSDPVIGGQDAIDAFTTNYKTEQAELKPAFEQFDKKAVDLSADPTAVLGAVDKAIPQASKYIIKDPEGYGISKYEKTMPFSKDAHEAIQSLLDALNKPEGATIADLRSLRETMRDNINFMTAPRVSQQISGLRKSIMDIIQDEVGKSTSTEAVEGLNHPLKTPLSDPRELFKRWAQNEESRATMESILGGSIDTQFRPFSQIIKTEETLNRIFGNTVSVKVAKDLLGTDFDRVAANYISQKVGEATDIAKNGFSSNKFATFLKQKAPELNEALVQHPEELNKIRATIDKMRILPDSPSINPSGTAKTLMERLQQLTGYLGKDGLLAIPGKLMHSVSEAYGEAQKHSELNRILSGNSQMGTEEQLANKTRQYGAFIKIERMQQATTNAINKGAGALFKSGEAIIPVAIPKLIPHEKQLDSYKKTASHLKDMASDPTRFSDALAEATKSLNDVAPNINGSLNLAAVRATQFLQSKLPTQNPSSTLTKPYEPSRSELAKFNRSLEIVEHPLNALKQLKDGTLTSETLEALHTVYPKLINQMQQAVMDNLNEKNVAKMTYQHKLMVSAFLGHDLTNSLSQPSIMSAQIQSAPNPTSGPTAPRPKTRVGPSQKGLGKLNSSTQFMTPMQQGLMRTER